MKVDIAKLSGMLDEKRFKHSEGVRDMAIKLAEIHGVDTKKAEIAGILHDCAKNIPHEKALEICRSEGVELKEICYKERALIHPYLGAHIAKKEFGIDDEEILSAIRNHTTGYENMTLLDKIIFIADLVEINRTYGEIEALRELAYKDIDAALLKLLDHNICHVINKGSALDIDTIKARNYLLNH